MFQSMAWLLHEPRLIAKVPVFCIIGVKPLLRNQQAPLSVSIGAVHLLTHLHTHLAYIYHSLWWSRRRCFHAKRRRRL